MERKPPTNLEKTLGFLARMKDKAGGAVIDPTHGSIPAAPDLQPGWIGGKPKKDRTNKNRRAMIAKSRRQNRHKSRSQNRQK